MKNRRISYKTILGIFIVQMFFLIGPSHVFCQTETLDIVSYTPPKGWTKTQKEGAVVYSKVDKNTNAFGLMTIYASAPSSGSAQKDFAHEWIEFVVKPFKAETSPKTETQNTPDGWQATVGASQIELDGGIKAGAILTVFSGYGKTVSILVIINDDSFSGQASSLFDSIKLDKGKAVANAAPANTNTPQSPANTANSTPIEHWVILKDFQDNQVAAEAKYNGKRVKIVGPVDFVLVENGLPVLRMGVPAWSGRQMFCIFPLSQKAAVARVTADQRVVMECTVRGNAGGVSRVGRVDLGSSVGRITLENCSLK